jgi:hypothetical protein
MALAGLGAGRRAPKLFVWATTDPAHHALFGRVLPLPEDKRCLVPVSRMAGIAAAIPLRRSGNHV